MPAGTINFPDTLPPPNYPLGEELEDSTLRSTFEDGTVQTRQKFTRIRTTYTVEWTNLPDTDKSVLQTFYKNDVKGGTCVQLGASAKRRNKTCALYRAAEI